MRFSIIVFLSAVLISCNGQPESSQLVEGKSDTVQEKQENQSVPDKVVEKSIDDYYEELSELKSPETLKGS